MVPEFELAVTGQVLLNQAQNKKPKAPTRSSHSLAITRTIKMIKCLGSGSGSVGRAVASDTRDPGFKSRHCQNFMYQLHNRKDEN